MKVFSKGELIERCWKNLRVNDIVKLKRNDRIPADIVVLGSSGDSATCYVETKSFGNHAKLWFLPLAERCLAQMEKQI